ncbi:MAG: lysine--tRNA ligase, partial [Verrucomicrobiota bacterium]
ELKQRMRYLDLIHGEGVRERFVARSRIIEAIRRVLVTRGYVEVEGPTLQESAGGAAARPFKTHHNALDMPLVLRIALELHLKRLLVGGLERVFELGRVYRNEGVSPRHNPEFTMLEAYEAYGDYATMMDTVEGLIRHVARQVLGTEVVEHRNAAGEVARIIDLRSWRRVRYKDLVREKAGADWFQLTPDERRQRAVVDLQLAGDIATGYEDFEVTGAVFEKLVEPTLIQPTFVTHLPRELVPLAKLSPDDPTTVEVFECCINGQEISPGYTEQNDPIEQRERLEHQAGGEQQKLDEDFLVALEHGMPPAGGIGIGIDRLCMMLLGQESIRDVILFPQLKPKA